MSSGQQASSSRERALALLGQGIDPEMVASAVGLDRSRISQFISDPEFSAEVAELRFKNLSAHTERDSKYDSMEDRLLQMLDDCTPYMIGKPWMILKAIATINNANRRGAQAPVNAAKVSEVVQINMPTVIMNHFVTNVNKQVIKVGETELVTLASSKMAGLNPLRIENGNGNETLELERSS